MAATIAAIATAIKDILAAELPQIDQASTDLYQPPVTTRSIALVLPPFRQQSRVEPAGVERGKMIVSHRIPAEFWTKINTGDLAGTIAKAREIGYQACMVLLANKTLNGTVGNVGFYGRGATGPLLEVDAAPVAIRLEQVPYFLTTVFVTCQDFTDAPE